MLTLRCTWIMKELFEGSCVLFYAQRSSHECLIIKMQVKLSVSVRRKEATMQGKKLIMSLGC